MMDRGTTSEDCSVSTTAKFLFVFILSWFGFPKILMSDRGTHFLNETIVAMLDKFRGYHEKSTPYHPQANGMVETFNKIMENAFTKVYNVKRNDWDVGILAVLWVYRGTCKKLIGQTTFRLVYG